MKRVVPVAVCIPAYDEVEEIAHTVASVFATGYPRDLLEVVVAVDGGDQAVCESARQAGARVVVVEPNQGSYAARNAAADAVARAEVLLFTDTDCRVSPQWITAHLEALDSAPMSGGAVRFVFAGTTPTPAEWVDATRHLRQQIYVERQGFAATCNLAVRRDDFERVRFDPTFRTGGDADFGTRAKEAGLALVYSPAAVIDHPARPDTAALLQKVNRIASGTARTLAMFGDSRPRTPRLKLAPYRSARAAGHRVGPLWGARACLLDYRAQRIIANAIRRGRAS
jgi:GT2 family glycosyltransferase